MLIHTHNNQIVYPIDLQGQGHCQGHYISIGWTRFRSICCKNLLSLASVIKLREHKLKIDLLTLWPWHLTFKMNGDVGSSSSNYLPSLVEISSSVLSVQCEQTYTHTNWHTAVKRLLHARLLLGRHESWICPWFDLERWQNWPCEGHSDVLLVLITTTCSLSSVEKQLQTSCQQSEKRILLSSWPTRNRFETIMLTNNTLNNILPLVWPPPGIASEALFWSSLFVIYVCKFDCNYVCLLTNTLGKRLSLRNFHNTCSMTLGSCH